MVGSPVIFDDHAKSRHTPVFVIPAKAGIQGIQTVTIPLDPGPRIQTFRGKLRRGDGFLRDRRI
jgi:hypothetical protein